MRRSNKRRKSSSFAKLFVTVCGILAIVAFAVYINQEDEDVVSVETVLQESISTVTPGFVVEEHRSTIINEEEFEEEEEEEEEEESTNADEEDEEESSNTDDDEEDEEIANENVDEIDFSFSEEDSVEEEVIAQIIEPVAVGSESEAGTETQDK